MSALSHAVGRFRRSLARDLRRHGRIGAVAGLVGVAMAVAITTAGQRWEIVIDGQVNRCLEDTWALLLDRRDRVVERGGVYAFDPPPAAAALFRDGTRFAKRIVGLPGDRVEVTLAATTINGVVVGEGLDLTDTLGMPPETYVRRFTVRPDTVFPMGETRDSFDGRYYGVVPVEALLGRARRLL